MMKKKTKAKVFRVFLIFNLIFSWSLISWPQEVRADSDCIRPSGETDHYSGGPRTYENPTYARDTTTCPGPDTTTYSSFSNENGNYDDGVHLNWTSNYSETLDTLKVLVRVTTANYSNNSWGIRYTDNAAEPNTTNGTVLSCTTNCSGLTDSSNNNTNVTGAVFEASLSTSLDLNNLKVGFIIAKGGGGGDSTADVQIYDVWTEGTWTAVTTLTQNDWLLMVDNDVLTPLDAWPSGARDLTDNVALTPLPYANDPVDPSDEIRIRMTIAVTGADLAAETESFILEHGKADDCTVVGSWTAVGTGDWGFASSSVGDNTTLTTLKVGVADVAGRYNRSDPTTTNPNLVPAGQDMEWDWHVVYNGSAGAGTYCFRMRKDDPADLDAYEATGYPKISTRPAVGDQMRHGEFFSSSAEQGFFWVD
jgi:hypothetical protein